MKPPSNLLLLAVLTLAPAVVKAEPKDDSPYRNLEIFARALSHIENSYVREVDQDQLIYGAIRGMLKVLDPHSSYLDPEELRVLTSDTEGRYGGIGVEVDVRDGWLTVVHVLDEGPAYRAGLRVGDRFLSIGSRPARDVPIGEAVRWMRGEAGTQVQVLVRRADQEESIALTLRREIISVEAVRTRVLPDRVVYLQLRAFQDNTAVDLRRALDAAVERTASSGGVAGLILDLRDNPGGLMSAAVLVADEFLSEGVIVSTRGRSGKLLRENRASAGGTRPNWPMVILVNGYSASASEIVAGALRDHKRAVLVGVRTFGKGSVQNVIALPDGSAMKLTTALYYTPSGSSIQAEGIEPDMVVEQIDAGALTASRRDDIRESSLEGHLRSSGASKRPSGRVGRGYRGVKQAQQRRGGELFPGDYQARMAHQILGALIVDRGENRKE